MFSKLKNNEALNRYFASLKFALYCTTHPLDGYWDLTHEKRGTMAAANTILIVTILVRVLKLQYTSFLFNQVYWPKVNIFLYIAGILFPLALWCVGNWGLTTLFDGKGRLGQVYMATCYAMTPYPLLQFPMIFFSNVITADEGAFYQVILVISMIWCVFLIIAAMIQIHEYKLGKTIGFTIATLFGMLVMVFILLLFFSMISQGISYFVSLTKEILYRM